MSGGENQPSQNLTRCLNEMDSSLLETAFAYIEIGNQDGAEQYVLAMSDEGVERALRNLKLLGGALKLESMKRMVKNKQKN